MGQAMNLDCSCGYSTTIATGEGLMGKSIDFIRVKFTPNELAGFEKALAANSVDDYFMGQRIALCGDCKELVSATMLDYVINGREQVVFKSCPKCDKTVAPCSEPFICPKCAKELRIKLGNLWD